MTQWLINIKIHPIINIIEYSYDDLIFNFILVNNPSYHFQSTSIHILDTMFQTHVVDNHNQNLFYINTSYGSHCVHKSNTLIISSNSYINLSNKHKIYTLHNKGNN
jgi:hypothetical protein